MIDQSIVEAAQHVTWPGAFVLAVLIIVVGWVLVRFFES